MSLLRLLERVPDMPTPSLETLLVPYFLFFCWETSTDTNPFAKPSIPTQCLGKQFRLFDRSHNTYLCSPLLLCQNGLEISLGSRPSSSSSTTTAINSNSNSRFRSLFKGATQNQHLPRSYQHDGPCPERRPIGTLSHRALRRVRQAHHQPIDNGVILLQHGPTVVILKILLSPAMSLHFFAVLVTSSLRVKQRQAPHLFGPFLTVKLPYSYLHAFANTKFPASRQNVSTGAPHQDEPSPAIANQPYDLPCSTVLIRGEWWNKRGRLRKLSCIHSEDERSSDEVALKIKLYSERHSFYLVALCKDYSSDLTSFQRLPCSFLTLLLEAE